MRFRLEDDERREDLRLQHTLIVATSVYNWGGFGRKAKPLSYLYEQESRATRIKQLGSKSLDMLRQKIKAGRDRAQKRKARNASRK